MFGKFCLVFFSAILFLFPVKVYAVSVVISETPVAISSDPFVISVSVTGATAGTNYLRIDLYKNETTNYFGETFNGIDWVTSSDGTQYLPVTIGEDKSWSGQVQGKIGEVPSNYDGTGEYKIRIRRYTAGGNYNNDEAKSSAISIVLSLPTPTVIPTNTPTPTKAPTPTKIPTPTKTPTPIKSGHTPTKNPTPTPLRSSSFVGQAKNPTSTSIPVKTNSLIQTKTNDDNERFEIVESASNTAMPTAILGASVSAVPTIEPTKTTQTVVKNDVTSPLRFFILLAGVGFLCACGILIYRQKMRDD